MAMDLREPTNAEIEADWHEFTGGPPILGALGRYEPGHVEGLRGEDAASGTRALITWARHGSDAELVSVHAAPPGSGGGSTLLDVVEQRLATAGIVRVVVATTNDNIVAAGFYQRRGYRLVEVRLDFMDGVRKLKPGVPLTGIDDLPLRDLWVFEKRLSRA